MNSVLRNAGREKIVSRLMGQRVHLPNLRPLYAGWPFAENPHKEKLKPIVNRLIEK